MFKDGDVTYDAASEQHSTDVIQNNGFFPVFQTTMNFTVHSPECAMLLFDVKESECLLVTLENIEIARVKTESFS